MSYIILDGSDDYLSIASAIDRSADTSWRIEIIFRNKNTTNINELHHFLGNNSNLNDYYAVGWTDLPKSFINYRIDGTSNLIEWTGAQYVSIIDNAFHTLILTYDGSTLSATLDGTASDSTISIVGLSFKDFQAIGRSSPSRAFLDIEYIRYYNTSAGDALIYDWDANASNRVAGGQPVLTDAASGNNATGVNFPTDGSAWSDLSSSGITADVAWSSPAPQFSGSATATQPSGVTATVAFAEPAAQFSGTATVAAATSTVTSDVITRNMGIGTGLSVAASEALDYVRLYNQSTGELVHEETGLSTNASGVFSFTAPIAAGDYDITWKLTSDGAKRMPTVTAS